MTKLSAQELMNLLVQLGVLLLAGRIFAELARKFRQPAVIGEIIAGILLGPTVFGLISPSGFESLFPPGQSNLVLDGFVQVAVVMLLFIAGLEVDLHVVLQQRSKAALTSLLGLTIPFTLGFIIPWSMPELFGFSNGSSHLVFSLFLGVAMGITALPVIARVLMDLGIFKSSLGMLVISSAMIDDLIGWQIFSIILALIGKNQHGMSLPMTIITTLGFAFGMLTVGRGLINRLLPWVNRKLAWPGGLLSISLALCFLFAAFTEFIGIHAIFGAFLFGVALGDSEHLSERAKEIIHQFINNIFAPLFFVAIGLKVNFAANFDPVLTIVIILIAYSGKILGSGAGAKLGGFSWRQSLAVGFGMNARGAMEIILGLIALTNGIINERLFVSLVVMALVTSMTSGPLMKWALKIKDQL